jgi:hypothetical protein
MLGDSAIRIGKRHFPAAEVDKLGAEVDVLGMQC